MKHSNSHVPNMIIYNARVHVVDQMNHVQEALAIAGNKILAIGTNEKFCHWQTDRPSSLMQKDTL